MLSSVISSHRGRPGRQAVGSAYRLDAAGPRRALARELKWRCRMPYRDTGDALEAKLRFLLDARRELDASIAETRRELEPYRAARRRSRVGTALRVSIVAVVVLFSCFAAVAFAVLLRLSCCSGCSRIDSTRADARSVAGAVEMYMAEHPESACATVDELVHGGFLNSAAPTTDVWDEPFVIECDGTEITVTSAGPDGEHGTEDDIQ